MFTEKAKEKFEEWYINYFIHNQRKDYLKYNNETNIRKFYRKCLAEQSGVIEDFAESLGYYIYIKPKGNKWSLYVDDSDCKGRHILVDYILMDTKQEARKEMIKQLNNLINEKEN